MKVLLVSPLPPPMGGIATLTKRIVNNLSSSDVEFDCVNVAHKVNDSNNNITNYRKLESIEILCRSLWGVFTRCVKRECDVIHINSSCGGGTLRDYLIERIAKIFHVPIIIQYHCDIENSIRRSSIARKLSKKCFSLANKVIVLNKSSLKYVEEMGYNAIILSNGISKDLIASEHSINKNIKNVVYTGRISKEKGCLEIYACAKANPQIVFYLAGLIDKEIEEKLRKINNIKLLGVLNHHKVIGLLDKADIFIFPTYSEGFSMSLLEAMARGVPCIATDVGANGDMLENKGGIIVKVRDSEAITNALDKVKKATLRSAMSKWNLNKVLDLYTEEKMFDTLNSIYTGTVATNKE